MRHVLGAAGGKPCRLFHFGGRQVVHLKNIVIYETLTGASLSLFLSLSSPFLIPAVRHGGIRFAY